MGVAQKRALGVTVGLLVAGKVPDDQRLVATAREQHVGAIKKKDFSQNHCPYSINRKHVFNRYTRIHTRSYVDPYTHSIHVQIIGRCPYFSREVAREVTQPLWPSRVPRRTSCSAMIGV